MIAMARASRTRAGRGGRIACRPQAATESSPVGARAGSLQEALCGAGPTDIGDEASIDRIMRRSVEA